MVDLSGTSTLEYIRTKFSLEFVQANIFPGCSDVEITEYTGVGGLCNDMFLMKVDGKMDLVIKTLIGDEQLEKSKKLGLTREALFFSYFLKHGDLAMFRNLRQSLNNSDSLGSPTGNSMAPVLYAEGCKKSGEKIIVMQGLNGCHSGNLLLADRHLPEIIESQILPGKGSDYFASLGHPLQWSKTQDDLRELANKFYYKITECVAEASILKDIETVPHSLGESTQDTPNWNLDPSKWNNFQKSDFTTQYAITKQAMLLAARLHGSTWNNPLLLSKDFSFLKNRGPYLGRGNPVNDWENEELIDCHKTWKSFLDEGIEAWRNFQKKRAETKPGLNLEKPNDLDSTDSSSKESESEGRKKMNDIENPLERMCCTDVHSIVIEPYLERCLEESIRKIDWEEFKKVSPNFSLVHGDFHPMNIFYHKGLAVGVTPNVGVPLHVDVPPDDVDIGTSTKGQTPVLLDWEAVRIGQGPQDIGQYMLNVSPAARRAWEKELVLDVYYNELCKTIRETSMGKETTIRKTNESTAEGTADINLPTKAEIWEQYQLSATSWFFWMMLFLADKVPPFFLQWFANQLADWVHTHFPEKGGGFERIPMLG